MKKILLIVGILIVVAGLVAFMVFKQQSGYTKVMTAKLVREDLATIVSGTGQIKPKTYVNVGATSFGRITHLYVKEGDRVKKGDILINSTGDGTIGRVAVFDADFPAVVDGHITILRFDDEELAWYAAAFLLSDLGQRQIYRYINGSSGQVEIYPQDIGRIWIKPPKSSEHRTQVGQAFKAAASLHASFYRELQSALAKI